MAKNLKLKKNLKGTEMLKTCPKGYRTILVVHGNSIKNASDQKIWIFLLFVALTNSSGANRVL